MKNQKKIPAETPLPALSRSANIFLTILAISQVVLFVLFNRNFPFDRAWTKSMDFLLKIELPTAAVTSFALSRTGLLILVCAVAFFTGRFVLSLFKGLDWNPLEVFSIGTLLGFCVMGLVIFGMGFLNLYKQDIFWGSTMGVLITGAAWMVICVGKEKVLENIQFVSKRLGALSLKPLLILFVVFAYLMTLVPEIFYDSLVYHIGLPHLYLLEGGFVDTPNLQFSRFPLLIQSLYVYGLSMGGDALAKMIHLAFLLLGALVVITLADRLEIGSASAMAILLMISIPVVQMNVWTTAVDAAMGVLALAAFVSAVLWSKKEENHWGLLCLAGIFTGSVFGTKYTGFLFIFAINAFLIYSSFQKKWTFIKIFQILMVFNLVAFVTLVPWLVRNFALTGNPLYPFLGSIFPNENLIPENIAEQSALSKGVTPAHFWGWFLLPWSLSTSGHGGSFDFLGPAVVAFLPSVYFIRDRKFSRAGVVFFLVYFLIGGIVSRHVRYLLPGVMLLAVFSGLGLGALFVEVRSGLWRGIFKLSAVIMVTTLLFWSISVSATSYAPYHVLSGKESRAAYVSYYHPGMNPYPPNNLFSDINNLPHDARLLFLGEEKVYGCPRPYVYSNVYDKTPFVEMANRSDNTDQLLEKIRAMGVTHMVINIAEAMRLKGYKIFPWREDKKSLVQSFFQEKTAILTVKETDGQKALVLLAVDGNPTRQPTWAILAPGVEEVLELKIQ